ncbi:MAG: GrpB family protein [Anaerolineae bacterium]|nr:GrpB family protein [Anaerolineae bacterium]
MKQEKMSDLGVVEGEVRLSSYSPKWKLYFERERQLLQATLGPCIADIQHFGSTAIENIQAKPIIDLMVGLHDLADLQKCAEGIETLGYIPYEGQVNLPDWRMFTKSYENQDHKKIITHHLHLVEYNGEFWITKMRFQAYLNAHPEVAEMYEQLKLALAQLYPNNRDAYTQGKTGLVNAINEMAQRAEHHAEQEDETSNPSFSMMLSLQ